MNKLTAEKCREQIDNLNAEWEGNGLTDEESLYLQALEIALPILEQQERGDRNRHSVRDENASFELLPGESEYDRLNRMYQWMRAKPAPGVNLDYMEGPGEWIEWDGGDRPVERETEVNLRYRDGEEAEGLAGLQSWKHYAEDDDIIAYRIIPERSTNQNGEQ